MRGRPKQSWLYNPTPRGVIISKLQTRNWPLPNSHCPEARMNCLVDGRVFFWFQMADPSLARQAKEEECPVLWCQLQRSHEGVSRGWIQRYVYLKSHIGSEAGGKLGSEFCFLGFKPQNLGRAGRLRQVFKQEKKNATSKLFLNMSNLQMWVT